MQNEKNDLKKFIKAEATALGFDFCAVARAGKVDEQVTLSLQSWLDKGMASCMNYMHNHFEKRNDPSLLVEGAKSVIVVALNYYPSVRKDESLPQFAYYSYGRDYHDVIKEKLKKLVEKISEHTPVEGRMFTDSAPVLERYWAMKSGIGFIGKNTQLIIPRAGSFYFIGEIICDLELEPDKPLNISCGNCNRCVEACPVGALDGKGHLDARRCISCQTIENKGEIEDFVAEAMGDNIYGCDICQKVCPFNRFAKPNNTPDFAPSDDFLQLDREALEKMTEEDFRIIFRKSAVKRAGFSGLKRNLKMSALRAK